METLSLTVNRRHYSVDVQPNCTLLDFLRDTLGLRGAKECCAVGECGACTVSVDGRTVNACLMLAVEADGAEVSTVEGLGDGGELTPLQDEFLKHGAAQCGFCIPGMVMSAEALLEQNPTPSEPEIREALSGNLCRCGGYNRMLAAVKAASARLREPDDNPAPLDVQAGSANSSVGANVVRRGGRERVTGAQPFLADLNAADALHVKLVTLDVARARLNTIDVAEALKVPGVVTILTADDLPIPMPRFGPVYQDRPILAVDETKYHGEPVAAVAAETLEAAEIAVDLIEVAYDVLPAVTDIASALSNQSDLVLSPTLRANDPLASTNVLKERSYGWGDVDAADADVVIENDYAFPMVTHFAIENVGCIADAKDDRLTIWSPVQHPYLLQRMMSELFETPLSKVRVLAPDPGGAFGGKQNPKFEPLLIYLSKATGRPCRLVLSLEETFQAMRRASAKVHVRTGFKRTGELVFQDIQSDYLIGAYVDIAERVMTKSNYLANGPYRTPNVRIEARAILSHTTPSCAFRGFGTPQINWAVESQMNAGARALGIDPVKIRLLNLASTGEEFVKGDVPADGIWPQSLMRAAEELGWREPKQKGRGRGIAVGIKPGATTGLSNSTVRLLADGSVQVYAGTSDMGQGARTIFAQIAADEFGVAVENVDVVSGDTDVVPFDLQTSASRSTVFMGNAILRACADIHEQLKELASTRFDLASEHIQIENGELRYGGNTLTIATLIRETSGAVNREWIGRGVMNKPNDKDHPLGGAPAFFEFNCTAFEVEVDEETGEILIHKHVTVGDVGKALNPLQVEMQDEGAAIMGLGHSMMEHLILDDEGRIRNLGALDYRIPTSKDLPLSLKTAAIENEDGPGPFGAKGVSEGAILCVSPALSAAVADASGVVINELPITSQRIWEGLNEKSCNEDR